MNDKNHLKRLRRIGQALKFNRDPGAWSSSRNRLRRNMHRILSKASRRTMKRHGEQLIEESLDDQHEKDQS